MNWNTRNCDQTLADDFCRQLEVAPVTARLLAQRGIRTVEEADLFLRPSLAHLRDPFELSGLSAAVDRICAAIEGGESIVVFGDYDVDGVTSTVQLVSILRMFGAEPRFCVPRRLEEGYGLSREAVDRATGGSAPGLFIALDCGTNANESIADLRAMGSDVIVIDHHQAKVAPPEDCILVNPHVGDPPDVPWMDMCTAGLVFKLLHGLLKRRRAAGDPVVEKIRLRDYLDLVSMGTIADLVPLKGENRILSWFGLLHLSANGRQGVRALAESSGIAVGQHLVSSDISYRLGPRINASGRLADASLPVELLLSEDAETCRGIARQLDAMNRERQSIERMIADEAVDEVMAAFKEDPGIVLFGEDWHPGVVGIVASRISRRFNKPTIVLGREGTVAKGSGRSVPGVDLVKVFTRCAHLLDHWGGHPMAAGLSLDAERVGDFRAAFVEGLRELHPEGLPERCLEVDAWVEARELDELLLGELEKLQPFGQGNEEPVFGLRAIRLNEDPEPFGKANFRFRIPFASGHPSGVPAVLWNSGQPPPGDVPIDLAIRFGWNLWRGNRSPQATLIEWRYAE